MNRLDAVAMLASKCMAECGLTMDGWSFGFDGAKRRAGACDYAARRITLSRYFAENARFSFRDVHDIIMHEAAHALAGHRAGHGPEWKRIALRLGSSGARCHSFVFCEPEYELRCDCGAIRSDRYRRSSHKTRRRSRRHYCKRCRRFAKCYRVVKAALPELGIQPSCRTHMQSIYNHVGLT